MSTFLGISATIPGNVKHGMAIKVAEARHIYEAKIVPTFGRDEEFEVNLALADEAIANEGDDALVIAEVFRVVGFSKGMLAGMRLAIKFAKDTTTQ